MFLFLIFKHIWLLIFIFHIKDDFNYYHKKILGEFKFRPTNSISTGRDFRKIEALNTKKNRLKMRKFLFSVPNGQHSRNCIRRKYRHFIKRLLMRDTFNDVKSLTVSKGVRSFIYDTSEIEYLSSDVASFLILLYLSLWTVNKFMFITPSS